MKEKNEKEKNENSNSLIPIFLILIVICFISSGLFIRNSYITNEMITDITHYHNEIHKGNAYFIKNWSDITGDGTITNFIFYTNDIYPHTTWIFEAEAEFTLQICENPIIATNGTEIKIRNHNRYYDNGANVTGYVGGTVSDLGDCIYDTVIGTGKDTTAQRTITGEFIGNKSTIYVFQLTKKSTGTHWFDYEIDWYEETTQIKNE